MVVGSTWSLDNFGPLPHPDRAGNRFSLTATDDASGMKYRWNHNDMSAPQAIKMMEELRVECEHFGHKMTRLRFDPQSTLVAHSVRAWGREHGVIVIPVSTEDKDGNAIAESANMHMLQRLRTVMIGNEAGLYGEGFDYDVLVSNSILHSKEGVNTTQAPYTIFTGRRRSARLLCAFGCACVYYAPEKSKARPRGIPAIYVGANTRTGAFRLLERGKPITQKIIETKNFVAELRSHIRNVYEGLAPTKLVYLYDNFPVFEDSQSINEFHHDIIRDVMAQPSSVPSASPSFGKRRHDVTVPRSREARDEPALKARRILVEHRGLEEPVSLVERGRRFNRTAVSLSERREMSVPAVERRVAGK